MKKKYLVLTFIIFMFLVLISGKCFAAVYNGKYNAYSITIPDEFVKKEEKIVRN